MSGLLHRLASHALGLGRVLRAGPPALPAAAAHAQAWPQAPGSGDDPGLQAPDAGDDSGQAPTGMPEPAGRGPGTALAAAKVDAPPEASDRHAPTGEDAAVVRPVPGQPAPVRRPARPGAIAADAPLPDPGNPTPRYVRGGATRVAGARPGAGEDGMPPGARAEAAPWQGPAAATLPATPRIDLAAGLVPTLLPPRAPGADGAGVALPPGAGGQRHAPPQQQEPTEVHVSIGRIEVTAVHEAAAPAVPAAPALAPMSLDAYLAQRERGRP